MSGNVDSQVHPIQSDLDPDASKDAVQRVPRHALVPGMYVVGLEGAKFTTTRWRGQFCVPESGRGLEELQDTDFTHAWIDRSKGRHLAESSSAPATPGPSEDPWTEGLKAAARVVASAKDVVRGVFAEARLGRAVNVRACEDLVHDICGSLDQHPGALTSLVRLRAMDEYTHMHSVAVCTLMVALARTLGLSDAQQRTAGLAGLLHDVGKAKLPLELLNKPASLSDLEFQVVQRHPQLGAHLLDVAGCMDTSARDVCLHHHERPDGRGYPFGRKGHELTLMARMASVCDVYDAVTSDRPYKRAWNPAEAVSRMATWHGQFDESVFHALVKSVGIFPVGSPVRLSNEVAAVVVAHNTSDLLRPSVKTFFCLKSQRAIEAQAINLSRTSVRILERLQTLPEGVGDLDQLWLPKAA